MKMTIASQVYLSATELSPNDKSITPDRGSPGSPLSVVHSVQSKHGAGESIMTDQVVAELDRME